MSEHGSVKLCCEPNSDWLTTSSRYKYCQKDEYELKKYYEQCKQEEYDDKNEYWSCKKQQDEYKKAWVSFNAFRHTEMAYTVCICQDHICANFVSKDDCKNKGGKCYNQKKAYYQCKDQCDDYKNEWYEKKDECYKE